MNCIIPLESKVTFNGPVKEICSISLEHDLTKNESEVLGNFYVSGTYKEHELSINTNDYTFTIPFSVELTNRIDPDTLEFEIDNFTYELDNNDMIINIDYSLNAIDYIESDENRNDYIEIDEDRNDYIEVDTDKQDNEILEIDNFIEDYEKTDDYTVYKIHKVKKEETLDSIALLYNTSKETILKTNNITSIEENDKLIIPFNND